MLIKQRHKSAFVIATEASAVRPFGPLDLIFLAVLGLLALGLLISAYILYTQRTGKKLYCLIGDKCDIVTKSEYSKTFGIDNSLLGIFYYGALLAVFALGISVPWPLVLLLSAIASIFSIYLVHIQLFVLRELCDYCMLSAFINWALTLIFGAVAAGFILS
jgi:uncharacterized membrane protein